MKAETIPLEQFIADLWHTYEDRCPSSRTCEEARRFSDTIHGTFSGQQLKDPALRRDAARILHLFLLQVLKLPDKDWGRYAGLKDLYDCRICANAIAQVCVRSLMQPVSRREFGALQPLLAEEAAAAIENVFFL